MKKIIALLLVTMILSGCALTTIRPYKKDAAASQPAKKSIPERIKEFVVKPEPVVVEEEVIEEVEEKEEDIK